MSASNRNHSQFGDTGADDSITRSASRVAIATDAYHSKIQDEIAQLRCFKNWALLKFSQMGEKPVDDLRRQLLELQIEIEDLRDFKSSVLRKLANIDERLVEQHPTSTQNDVCHLC